MAPVGTVKALLTLQEGEIGTTPRPRMLAAEEGTVDRVPSVDFKAAWVEAMDVAIGAAAAGGVANVTVQIIPAGLPRHGLVI